MSCHFIILTRQYSWAKIVIITITVINDKEGREREAKEINRWERNKE